MNNMNKLIFVAFYALLASSCYNDTTIEKETLRGAIIEPIEQYNTKDDTIAAMAMAFAWKESRMKEDAVSECGRFVGCLQLSKIMVDEANRILGYQCFSYDDRYDKQGSYAIFKVIQLHHNKNLDIEKAMTLWNRNAGNKYRQDVANRYNSNLENINDLENYFEL